MLRFYAFARLCSTLAADAGASSLATRTSARGKARPTLDDNFSRRETGYGTTYTLRTKDLRRWAYQTCKDAALSPFDVASAAPTHLLPSFFSLPDPPPRRGTGYGMG